MIKKLKTIIYLCIYGLIMVTALPILLVANQTFPRWKDWGDKSKKA